MKFNIFNANNLKVVRENYVKQFKVKEIEITPCEKFVACLEKLSKNYVLALRDTATTETLQIANQNDIEFFEGYELAPNYTNSLRLNLCKKICNIYLQICQMVKALNILENKEPSKRQQLSDIRLDIQAINNIVLNIYQHLTLTNNVPIQNFENDDQNNDCNLLQNIKDLILNLINELTEFNALNIISYITKQIDCIINKLNILMLKI